MELLNSDWPANILAGVHFQIQENGLMSPDGVCTISAGTRLLISHSKDFSHRSHDIVMNTSEKYIEY